MKLNPHKNEFYNYLISSMSGQNGPFCPLQMTLYYNE